jgi:putative SOS response-associated peptidase YedK
MCGRYAASAEIDDLVEEFEVDMVSERAGEEPLPPDYNVAPTKQVYAVLERVSKEDEQVTRRLAQMRWGLIPSWAKDVKIGSRMINARLETAAEKPAFKRAWASRRCILPADGFYEWYFIRAREGERLAMAGLYEFWRDDTVPEGEPGAWVVSCAVLTTSATDDVGRLHDRMPLLVPVEQRDRWLDPKTAGPSAKEISTVLLPALPGILEAYPVSTAVNNVARVDRAGAGWRVIESSISLRAKREWSSTHQRAVRARGAVSWSSGTGQAAGPGHAT